MSWFMVDVESDGPAPGLYSMISIGVVLVEPGLQRTFGGRLRPLDDATYDPNALLVSRLTHENTLKFPDPQETMQKLSDWVAANNAPKSKPRFISDNNGFDWQFVNYYCWRFLGKNPFGHSSTNLGSLYKGAVRNMCENFKHLRKTKHTHDPVDDAKGNAEALLTIIEAKRLVFPL